MKLLILLFPLLAAQAFAAPEAKDPQPAPNVTTQNGGDTYNFYFQKAPGPQEVHQGGSGGSGSPLPHEPVAEPRAESPDPLPTRKEPLIDKITASMPADDSEPGRVDLELGLLGAGADARTGGFLGATFSANPYVALEGRVFGLADSSETPSTGSLSATGMVDSRDHSTASGAMVSLLLSPVSTKFFRLGGFVGGMYAHEEISRKTETMDATGMSSSSQELPSKNTTTMLWGLESTVYATRHLGLNGYFAVAADSSFTQLGLGVVYRL